MIEFFYGGETYIGSYSDEGELDVNPSNEDALSFLQSIEYELEGYYFPTNDYKLKEIASKIIGNFIGNLDYEYKEGSVYWFCSKSSLRILMILSRAIDLLL